jgi:hypothetical protein
VQVRVTEFSSGETVVRAGMPRSACCLKPGHDPPACHPSCFVEDPCLGLYDFIASRFPTRTTFGRDKPIA